VAGGVGRISLRRALIVVQVALSLVLVASALLFTRSLTRLLTLDAGFNRENLLVARVNFRRLNVPPERRIEFRSQMVERLKAVPGVAAVAEADTIPLTGVGRENAVWKEGDANTRINVSFNRVGIDYFKTLQLPLRTGRDFSAHDTLSSPRVAIVDETLARQMNETDPIGHRFVVEATPYEPETAYEVVGVVRDAKFEDLKEGPLPMMYLSALQDSQPPAWRPFLIRSSLPQAQLTASINNALQEMNPSLDTVFEWFETMVQGSMLRERLMATLSGFFGVLAVVLATIGLYGILSYAVESRTNEIGIRIALGARMREVVSLILREALLLVAIGIVAGVPAVFVVARFAETLLFNLSPMDPLSLLLAGVVMLVVAAVAAYLPARRATKVDPLVALRYE
jgi:predicted permease